MFFISSRALAQVDESYIREAIGCNGGIIMKNGVRYDFALEASKKEGSHQDLVLKVSPDTWQPPYGFCVEWNQQNSQQFEVSLNIGDTQCVGSGSELIRTQLSVPNEGNLSSILEYSRKMENSEVKTLEVVCEYLN